MPRFYLDQLSEFFEDYKALEGDKKKVQKFYSKSIARDIIKASAAKYAKMMNKGEIDQI